jgi:hypothetical protein
MCLMVFDYRRIKTFVICYHDETDCLIIFALQNIIDIRKTTFFQSVYMT